MDGVQLPQDHRATTERQFAFYHITPFHGWGSTAAWPHNHYWEAFYFLPQAPRNSWYSFDPIQKNESLNRPWGHPWNWKRAPWIENPVSWPLCHLLVCLFVHSMVFKWLITVKCNYKLLWSLKSWFGKNS